jgi:hypothetical protein
VKKIEKELVRLEYSKTFMENLRTRFLNPHTATVLGE